jgi:iron complex transport system substrate-binding protein
MKRRLIPGLLLALAAFAQPARIVSTSPSITESLFALGLGDRVVGVSTYCHYPPAVLRLAKIGTFIKPDAEKIAVRVRTWWWFRRRSRLYHCPESCGLGIRYVEVEPGSWPTCTLIQDIGRATGVEARAAAWSPQSARGWMPFARNRSPQRATVLLIVGRDPGCSAI